MRQNQERAGAQASAQRRQAAALRLAFQAPPKTQRAPNFSAGSPRVQKRDRSSVHPRSIRPIRRVVVTPFSLSSEAVPPTDARCNPNGANAVGTCLEYRYPFPSPLWPCKHSPSSNLCASKYPQTRMSQPMRGDFLLRATENHRDTRARRGNPRPTGFGGSGSTASEPPAVDRAHEILRHLVGNVSSGRFGPEGRLKGQLEGRKLAARRLQGSAGG